MIGQSENVGVKMTLKAAKKLFLDRPAVINRLDRVARRRLATFGGYCMRTARNLIKPKKDMSVAEFPEELRALIGPQRLALKRDAKGKFVAGSGKKLQAELRREIIPWPQTTGAPGQPPKYTVTFTDGGKKFNQFKDLIIFIVEPSLASVVIGPIIFDKKDTPGLLEFGGQATRYVPTWFRDGSGQIRTTHIKRSTRYAAHPYMGTAFDRALDAKVPRIFQDIL